MTNENNNYYRYCFQCDKWLKKEELKEVDYGEQPGHESGKALYCTVCQHELTGDIQIFHCHKHEEEILKVWGVMDGKNKEKVFHQECPQEQQKNQEPELPFWKKIPMPAVIGSLIAIPLTLLIAFKAWWGKKKKQIATTIKFKQKPDNERPE